jgi:hypothetical protein
MSQRTIQARADLLNYGFPANIANKLFAVRSLFYLRYLRLTGTGFLIYEKVVGQCLQCLKLLAMQYSFKSEVSSSQLDSHPSLIP